MNNEDDKISELTKPPCGNQDIDRFLDLLDKGIEQHPD